MIIDLYNIRLNLLFEEKRAEFKAYIQYHYCSHYDELMRLPFVELKLSEQQILANISILIFRSTLSKLVNISFLLNMSIRWIPDVFIPTKILKFKYQIRRKISSLTFSIVAFVHLKQNYF